MLSIGSVSNLQGHFINSNEVESEGRGVWASRIYSEFILYSIIIS